MRQMKTLSLLTRCCCPQPQRKCNKNSLAIERTYRKNEVCFSRLESAQYSCACWPVSHHRLYLVPTGVAAVCQQQHREMRSVTAKIHK